MNILLELLLVVLGGCFAMLMLVWAFGLAELVIPPAAAAVRAIPSPPRWLWRIMLAFVAAAFLFAFAVILITGE